MRRRVAKRSSSTLLRWCAGTSMTQIIQMWAGTESIRDAHRASHQLMILEVVCYPLENGNEHI